MDPPQPDPQCDDAEAFHVALLQLVQDARWMRTLDEQELEDAALRRSVVTRAGECAKRTLELLRIHSTSADGARSGGDEGEWSVGEGSGEGTVERGPDSAAIAFVASFSVSARRACLATADVRDKWQVLAAVDGLGRELARTLEAVERALGRATSVDEWKQRVGNALRVRRAYVRFGVAVTSQRPPADGEMLSRLRLIGTAIVKLASDDVYGMMRPNDRRIVREFHDRILAWLRAGAVDVVGGQRLWRDVANMVELIMDINRRPELAVHDAGLARECIRLVEAGHGDEARRRAVDLIGRDRELDHALRHASSNGELLGHLARVLATLEPTSHDEDTSVHAHEGLGG